MKNKKGVGRPRKEIDKRLFEKLCRLQCTQEEIASCLECSADTLERWCKREYRKNFAEVFREKRSRGKASLRHTQWELAKKSPAMAIFLGKNYLGQNDHQNVELSGKIELNTLAELVMEEAVTIANGK